MTKIRFILCYLLTIVSAISIAQNPYNTSSFNEKRPAYVGPPIEDMRNAQIHLTQVANENINEYKMFVEKALIAMGNDSTSVEYKAQLEAIAYFMNSVEESVEEKNWAYVGNDLAKAKSKFYTDLTHYRMQFSEEQKLNLKENYTSQSDELIFMKIKPTWQDKTINLYGEASENSLVITKLNKEWPIISTGSLFNGFYKVKINTNGLVLEGYIKSEYIEKVQ